MCVYPVMSCVLRNDSGGKSFKKRLDFFLAYHIASSSFMSFEVKH